MPEKCSNETIVQCDKKGAHLVSGTLNIDSDYLPSYKKRIKYKQGKELLLRAAKMNTFKENPFVFDATAGLGYDSLLFASTNAHVLSFERNPIIAFMTASSLLMGKNTSELQHIISRMSLICGDFISCIEQATFYPKLENNLNIKGSIPIVSGQPLSLPKPDVVYLDPMFPATRKRAAAKKKLQLLQKLEEPCEDEAALLNAAFACEPCKIIVKRPIKGPYLARKNPHYSIKGTSIRFDCFSLRTPHN